MTGEGSAMLGQTYGVREYKIEEQGNLDGKTWKDTLAIDVEAGV